jgi:hypothetical protein
VHPEIESQLIEVVEAATVAPPPKGEHPKVEKFTRISGFDPAHDLQ